MTKYSALLSAVIALWACGENVRGCPIDENYAAANSGIDVDVAPPFRCHYTVYESPATVNFLMHYNAPDAWYAGRQTVHAVFARHVTGYLPIGEPATFLWRSGPECLGSPACLGLTVSYRAATGTPDFGTYTDQYRASGATPIGDALFQMTITGRIGSLADVGGPTALPAASAGHWTASVVGDTLSYQYQWYVDAAQVAGATGRSYVRAFYDESGTQHTVSVTAKMMDDATVTRVKTVTLQMTAGWSGPGSIAANQSGSWSATAQGARMPLTACEWWVDGSEVEASSCTLNYAFPSAGSYGLSVIVTDARGISASSPVFGVQVTTPGCFPPECYESLKAPQNEGRHVRRIPRPVRPL